MSLLSDSKGYIGARDPGRAGGSYWAICFDILMISLFRQLCDTLRPVVRSSRLSIQGGQLLLQPLPAFDRSVALTAFEGLIWPHAFHVV